MPACELTGVGVVILGLLVEGPAHPYQVFQTLELRQDTRLVRVNAGAVYHGMERLERDGLVAKVGTQREGRRPERTTYALTEAGRTALDQHARAFLVDDLPAFPLFLVGLAEAHNLPADVVAAALRERRERRAGELAHLRASLAKLQARGLERRYVIEVEFEAHQLAAELDWIDGVLNDLAGGTLDWGAPSTTPTDPRCAATSLKEPS